MLQQIFQSVVDAGRAGDENHDSIVVTENGIDEQQLLWTSNFGQK